MIFAEMSYPGDYHGIHDELVTFLSAHFDRIDSGLQGDSWIWLVANEEKVVLDTFTSMKHQIKSEKPGQFVDNVIAILQGKYNLTVFDKPQLESHEAT